MRQLIYAHKLSISATLIILKGFCLRCGITRVIAIYSSCLLVSSVRGQDRGGLRAPWEFLMLLTPLAQELQADGSSYSVT